MFTRHSYNPGASGSATSGFLTGPSLAARNFQAGLSRGEGVAASETGLILSSAATAAYAADRSSAETGKPRLCQCDSRCEGRRKQTALLTTPPPHDAGALQHGQRRALQVDQRRGRVCLLQAG